MAQTTAQPAARKKNTVLAQLCGASFGFYMTNAAVVGYLAVYLYSLGYSDAQVGVITAINSALSIIAAPIWGVLADRWRSTVKAVLLCTGVGSLLYAAVPLVSGAEVAGLPVILVLIPLALFFRNPSTSLLDSVFLRASERHGINYGLIRATGSFAFAIASILLGIIVPKTGAGLTCVLALIITVPALTLAVLGSRGDQQPAGRSASLRELRFKELFSNRLLMSYMLLSAIMTLILYCNFTFQPRLLESINVDGARVGLVSGSKAFIEVPFIALLPVLRRKFKLEHIIAAAGFMFAGMGLLFAFSGELWHIVAVSLTLDGVGAGLFYGASSIYVFSLAPDHLKATAQTLVGAMSSLSGVVGNLLGGFLSNNFGVQSFYLTVGILGTIATVLFIITRRRFATTK